MRKLDRMMCMMCAVALAVPCVALADGADTPNGAVPLIAALPFADSGDTTGSTNFITNGGLNLPFPYDGEDHLYQINLGADNVVDFSLDLSGSTGDLALFLLTDPSDPTSLIAHSQDAIGPGAGPELILNADTGSFAPGTYWLWIDSYYAAGTPGSAGSYSLDVTGTLPEPASIALLAMGGLAAVRRRRR